MWLYSRSLLGVAVFMACGCNADGSAADPSSAEALDQVTQALCPCPPSLKIKVAPKTYAACNAIRCAKVAWTAGGTGGATGECFVVGLNSGCDCYEGQTRTCNTASPNQVCSAVGTTCGVSHCGVAGLGSTATSSWETACHTWP